MIWYSAEDCKKYFTDYVKKNNINSKEFYPLLRYTLSGKLTGPDLFSAIFYLGPEETSKRLQNFHDKFI